MINLIRRIAGKLLRLVEKIEVGQRFAELDRWRVDRGDLTLRLDYILTPESLVWDVGGYEGQWASDIFARFGCNVDVFEPMPAAAANIQRRFAANPLVHVYPYALGSKNENGSLSLAADASRLSEVGVGVGTVSVEIRDVMEVWLSLGAQPVALMKINIEGAEYDLMERMVEGGLVSKIDNIQVQFHDFVPHARERKEKITALLMKTHERSWCYEFVWENWCRRVSVKV